MLLAYCRPGFERECFLEIKELLTPEFDALKVKDLVVESGFVLVETGQTHYSKRIFDEVLHWDRLTFIRQIIPAICEVIDVPPENRATFIADVIETTLKQTNNPQHFGTVLPEFPDTNDGKSLGKFVKGVGLALFNALKRNQRIKQGVKNGVVARLHLFAADSKHFIICYSYPGQGAPWPMGVPRLRLPQDAPSRATLKLEEAILTFIGRDDEKHYFSPGMTAVDLGAAPGGWAYQLLRRGLYTVAVDNGNMKPELFASGLLEHRREDAFSFHPTVPVDWLVCDVVEKPKQVIKLIEKWATKEWMRYAIFNLKLPMKTRFESLSLYLDEITERLGPTWQLRAKQLYHDRKEVTVFLKHKN